MTGKKYFVITLASLIAFVLFIEGNYTISKELGQNLNFASGALTNSEQNISMENTKEVINSTLRTKGNELLDAGKYQEAITYYEKAIAINPNDTAALYNKGLALSLLGRNEEAIPYFDKTLTISPNDLATLTMKGVALYKLDRNEEAITYYDKVLAIDA